MKGFPYTKVFSKTPHEHQMFLELFISRGRGRRREHVVGLFTNLRIDRKTLPEGMYAYDIRDCDSNGRCESIAKHVLVNHWGTIITPNQIQSLENHVECGIGDWSYCGYDTYKDYIGG